MRMRCNATCKMGKNDHLFGIFDPDFFYSLHNFYGTTMMNKGALLMRMAIPKRFLLDNVNCMYVFKEQLCSHRKPYYSLDCHGGAVGSSVLP